MDPIVYINRETGQKEIEKVYGEKAIKLLYGKDIISRIFGAPLLYVISRIPFFSSLYGLWQKLPCTVRKIKSFIKAFHIDTSEFQDSVSSFRSFNDFFVRKLKPEARPIAGLGNENVATMPADGRYRFFPKINEADGFAVKGQKFDLNALLEDKELAAKYAKGSMVMARLCPSDYHRYHFPCDCVPGPTRVINGWLYSVNPVAIKRNINIFTQNKRTICQLDTKSFGKVLFIEVGATNVGSINQTYEPNQFYPKGAEKGYFAFGASALIMLFEPGKIAFDADLDSSQHIEIKCLMGQSLGSKYEV